MTVIVFLIDNSASMSQRTCLGTSLLDIAKGCVEEFYKIRMKSSRSDRYYIFSLDNEPNELKSLEPKQSLHVIRMALDAIRPNGYTSLGIGIRRTFDMLNLMRINNALENYGMGRYPSQIEHAIVVCVTDGGSLTSDSGVMKGELTLPVLNANVPGYEYTVEPFRWDYKFYSIVLRFPGFQAMRSEASKFIQTDETCPIRSMCEVTGGRAYKITNERTLHQCLESLCQKCFPGVVLHFMKLDENNETNKSELQPWHNCKKMIYVKSSSVGTSSSHWPIPESYSPEDVKPDYLPPRTAHPIVCFSTQKMPVPRLLEHFPVDRYELEPSPLTQYILERHDPNFVWQCYVPKSGKNQDFPFGYLKAGSELQSVHLYVLSYNFPALVDLLSVLTDTFKMRVSESWGQQFAHYLGMVPKYYLPPLLRAFEKIGLPSIIKPESIEHILPFNVKTALQKLRQAAKVILDTEGRAMPTPPCALLCRSSGPLKRVLDTGPAITRMQPVSHKRARLDMGCYFEAKLVSRAGMRSMVRKSMQNLRVLASTGMAIPGTSNSYSAPSRPMEREGIYEQPMAQMGDYANYKYDKLPAPLLDLNPAPERKETFGNPFRRKSASSGQGQPFMPSSSMFEADEKFVEDMLTNCLSKRSAHNAELGRNKGRLPLNVTYYNWRRSTPQSSIVSSPCGSPMPSDMGGLSPHPDPDGLLLDEDDDMGERLDTLDLNGEDLHSPPGFLAPPCSPITFAEVAMHRTEYQHNRAQLKRITTILRHPKIDGGQVFEILMSFQGPYKLQHTMICRCLNKSIQFKRDPITELIRHYLSYLVYHNHNGVNQKSTIEETKMVNGHVN